MEFKFLEVEGTIRAKLALGQFLDFPATPSARNFCLLKKVRFLPLGHLLPFIFFDNGRTKKIFFCLRYEHMYLENIQLKWCYFVIWLKMEKNPQLRFPKNEILIKSNFSHFLLLFFRLFSKNCQKVKITNLTTNDQNYQILLETCFLLSKDLT